MPDKDDKGEKKLWYSLVKKHGGRAEEVYHRMLNSGKYDHLFSAKTLAKRDRHKKKD